MTSDTDYASDCSWKLTWFTAAEASLACACEHLSGCTSLRTSPGMSGRMLRAYSQNSQKVTAHALQCILAKACCSLKSHSDMMDMAVDRMGCPDCTASGSQLRHSCSRRQ